MDDWGDSWAHDKITVVISSGPEREFGVYSFKLEGWVSLLYTPRLEVAVQFWDERSSYRSPAEILPGWWHVV